MTNLQNLQAELTEVKASITALRAENKIEEAHAKLAEVKEIENKIKLEIELEEAMKIENIKEEKGGVKVENKVFNGADILRAGIKNAVGHKLSEREKEIVKVENITGGTLIMPKEVVTRIEELKREIKSFETVVGAKRVTTLEGSFVVDATETQELDVLVDGVDISESDDLNFKSVTFKLEQRGALIPLSNTVLKFSDNDLVNFVARLFVKRYIKTVNAKAVALLKKDKVAIAMTGAKDLNKALLTKVDPALVGESVVVTNQDGLVKLVEQEGANGVSYIQPDMTKAPIPVINGCPIVTFSNAQLPTVAGKAPIFAGALAEAIEVVSNGAMEFKVGEDFRKNVTLCRAICYMDVIKKDADAYFVGELTV